MGDALTVILLLFLLTGVGITAWWAITSKESYINRKRGETFRASVIRHARLILEDKCSTPTARDVAASWLAYVAEPKLLLRDASRTPVREENDAWIEDLCGKHATVIRDGFGHLAVLAVLENRRKGTAMRTLLANAAPRDPSVLWRMRPHPEKLRGQEQEAYWIRGSLEVVKHVEVGRSVARALRDRVAEGV